MGISSDGRASRYFSGTFRQVAETACLSRAGLGGGVCARVQGAREQEAQWQQTGYRA